MTHCQMGICNSCESTSVATAKLILEDGQLQEFLNPVKVSYVLQKNPTCFVCDSDDMDFGGFVSAVNGDKELQLGQLYFVLPLSWLNKPLRAEEMANLAVTASLALRMRKNKRCFGCGCKGVNQLVFNIKKDAKPNWTVGCRGSGGGGHHQENLRRRRGRGDGGGSFITRLSVILEDEDRKEGGHES